MRRLSAIAALFVLMFALSARGSLITLTTSAPPGSPLSIPSNSTAAGSLLVTIFNDANPDTASNFMSAWQTKLQIVPDGGAVGNLTFNNPTTSNPADPAGPPGYIFANGLGISATKSVGNTVLDTNDFDSAAAGTQVPTSPGASLLNLDFTASAGAEGTFGIFAVRGAASTGWTDAATPLAQSRSFANVPGGSGLVRIGEVLVTVPEPVSVSALAMIFAAFAHRRARRNLSA